MPLRCPPWIRRLNAEYPVQQVEVATFVRATDRRIHEMTKVLAYVDQQPPPGTRPLRLG